MLRKGIYFLTVILILGLPLVLPLRVESSILIFLIGLTAVSYAIALVLPRLIKRKLGSTATFGYNPTTAYMTGNKARKAGKNSASGNEKADAARNVAAGKNGQPEIITSSNGRGDKNVHS